MKYAFSLIICMASLLFFASCGKNEEGRNSKSEKKESVGLFPVNMGAKPALSTEKENWLSILNLTLPEIFLMV
jgi:hypothetical protein